MLARMKAGIWPLVALIALSCWLVGCGRSENLPMASLRKNNVRPRARAPQPGGVPYRIAVAGMSSPSQAAETYGPIMDYLTKKLKHPTQLALASSYGDLNKMVGSGEAIAAFVCSGGYVTGRADFGFELVAAPEFNGQPVYYCYIIVPTESRARRLRDLKGRRFAFTDRDSNTGCGVPTYHILKMGYRLDSFFSELIYTKSHDLAIAAVRDGIVDGAAVDNLVYELAIRRDPRVKLETRVATRYGPCASPPIVVNPNAPEEFKRSLKQAVLSMRKDAQGRRLLRSIAADRFVEIQDSAYDGIRAMRREMAVWASRPRGGDR